MSSAADPRVELLRARVRDIPDFPKPGILFRDLTPLMGDASTFRQAVDLLAERIAPHRPELIVAIESRGFIFGAPVAAALGIGFVPVRKPGKLPHKTARRDYALEYGTDAWRCTPTRSCRARAWRWSTTCWRRAAPRARRIHLVRELGGSVVVAALRRRAGVPGRPRTAGRRSDRVLDRLLR